jgi:parallel beta-helix repeat protein
VSELAVSGLNLTFEMERGAILKRTAGNFVLCSSPGLRIRGGTIDGGRSGDTAKGIVGVNCGVDLEDVILQNIGGWGINLSGSGINFSMRRCTVTNTGYAPILWQSTDSRPLGVMIKENVFDRSSGYVSQGVMHIRATTAGALIVAPRVVDNNVRLPPVTSVSQLDPSIMGNSVGIEIWNASDAEILGNSVQYGKIGISIAGCANAKIIGNGVSESSQYGIEVTTGSNRAAVVGNTVCSVNGPFNSGAPASGVSISVASQNAKVISNQLYGCTNTVLVTPDSTGTVSNYNS